jgi:hypothetical protein
MKLSLKNCDIYLRIDTATPKGVLLMFLGFLISLLLLALCVGQLSLPYFGKSIWDLGAFGVSWVFGEFCRLGGLAVDWAAGVLPTLTDRIAVNFSVVTCAVGVLWLTTIYRRVHKTGRFEARIFDGVMVAVSVVLMGFYFCCLDEVLPFGASFFARCALFCSICLLVFCVSVPLAHCAKVVGRGPKGKKEDLESYEVTYFGFVLTCVIAAMVTGFHGAGESSVPFFAYELLNAGLHFLANLVALGMSLEFLEVIQKAAADSLRAGTLPTAPATGESGAAPSAATAGTASEPIPAHPNAPRGPTAQDWREGR